MLDTFVRALWSQAPEKCGVQLWRKDTKKNWSVAPGHVPTFIKNVSDERTDFYMAAGLAPKHLNKPSNNRTPASQVVGIPGIWADIDVNGGPEGKTGAAPTLEDAQRLAIDGILEPTLLVHSGYGVQAWWLFEDGIWLFGSEDERQQAARLVAAFQAGLRLRARREGWGLDSTHDLARLMRIPGTYNCKGMDQGVAPMPVELLDYEGPRHDIITIGGVVQEYMGEAMQGLRRVTGEGIDIVLQGRTSQPPMWKLEELMAANVDFKVVWEHRASSRTRDWSMSEYEMSIANYIARAGFDDQEMADTLVYHRIKYGDPKGKADRVDYIAQLIGKARQGVEDQDDEEELAIERADAVDQLSSMAKAGAADPVRATTLFSKVVGGPEVKELIQDGRDPDTARYRLVLADGREVPIGPAAVLIDAAKFRERFMVVTGKLPHRIKGDKWDKVVQAMLDAATVNEGEEDSRGARVLAWLDGYVDQGLSTDRNAACQSRDPFEHDDEVYIYLDSFAHWLRRIRSERLPVADLKQLMIAAGFERRTVSYINEHEKKTSRSYWVIPKEAIAGAR